LVGDLRLQSPIAGYGGDDLVAFATHVASLMGGSAARLSVADARFDSAMADNRPGSSGVLIKIGTRNVLFRTISKSA
jgi:hypothetical protein